MDDSLAKRRVFFSSKMCFMYKCFNNLVPDFISDIIPPFVREVSNYPLRNRDNLTNIYTRVQKFLTDRVSLRLCLTEMNCSLI